MSGKTEGSPLVGKEASEQTNGFNERLMTASAVTFLITIMVIKTQLTAYLFSMSTFPTAYSFYSCIVTELLLIPAFLIKPSTWGVPIKEMFLAPTYSLTLIVVFTTFDLAFTNIALANISITLQQCIAATNPFWTLCIESFLHRKWQHPLVYGVVVGVVVGAVFVAIGDVKRINVLGVIAACIAVLCSSSKAAFTHSAFKKYKSHLGALALLFWVDLLMMPIFIPWVLISGELVALFESNMSAVQWLQFTGTAALGGVRALSQFLVLSLVTATSTSIVNIFALVFNILLSSLWQPLEATPFMIVGVIMVPVFTALYTWFKQDKTACFGIMQSGSA
eukprot:CAMPEP_0115857518 /NCGR_PEP_ID=MMETSP0287-20121206/15616_1 /TAXON_ID=412157 /ORGANISM="Chrysochromulina rotalis, Strain UIO044" /LENGTH=334 /DNA_ID=CAMNT_0003311739 /DNA_START=44 /DNA_END=1048 /DNA_ORIENTATION=+